MRAVRSCGAGSVSSRRAMYGYALARTCARPGAAGALPRESRGARLTARDSARRSSAKTARRVAS
eukprot:scaffold2090_cov225-Prasinococcus_capsulatus_cf.AAC.34